MGKRFSDDERAFLSRLLDSEDAEEDTADDVEDEPAEEEEADEFTYRGKRYRHVADETPEPAKKTPAKKAPAKKAAAADPEPEAPKRRRFVS